MKTKIAAKKSATITVRVPRAAAPVTAPTQASQPKSKADFIRSLGMKAGKKLTAKEVVALGAKQGIKLSEAYVYSVLAPKKPAVLVKGPGIAKATPTTVDVLRAAASELGLAKAIEVLTGDRALVQRLTGSGT